MSVARGWRALPRWSAEEEEASRVPDANLPALTAEQVREGISFEIL